eukprot:SAG31_NODE_4482_length_3197_cov_2.463202_6_plen_86_part_00
MDNFHAPRSVEEGGLYACGAGMELTLPSVQVLFAHHHGLHGRVTTDAASLLGSALCTARFTGLRSGCASSFLTLSCHFVDDSQSG